jgi:hypothetical protein
MYISIILLKTLNEVSTNNFILRKFVSIIENKKWFTINQDNKSRKLQLDSNINKMQICFLII